MRQLTEITMMVMLIVTSLAGMVSTYVNHGGNVPVEARIPGLPQNATESQPSTLPDASVTNVTVVDVVTEAPSPPEPKFVTRIQAPKYQEWELVSDMKVSATPAEYTPWTGNGIPFINIYYRFPDGRAWNDTGMLHNGLLRLDGSAGYDVCAQNLIRFWEWEHTVVDATEATNRSLVYWSMPMPEDPNQLLGSGENCYTRVLATSEWLVRACYEGDGEITPYHEEQKGDTTIGHLDFMDGCGQFNYIFPPP